MGSRRHERNPPGARTPRGGQNQINTGMVAIFLLPRIEQSKTDLVYTWAIFNIEIMCIIRKERNVVC